MPSAGEFRSPSPFIQQSESESDETLPLLSKLKSSSPTEIDDDSSQIVTISQKETTAYTTQTKPNILGMICVAIGTGFVCTGGSIVALLNGSVLEIMLGRYIVQMLIGFSWWFIRPPKNNIHWYGDHRNEILNIWIRGSFYFLLVFGWYRGLELVPIGDAEGIIFIAPLLIVFIARFVLKEPLSKAFPITLLLTIAGIIFVCQPKFIFGNTGTTTRQVSIAGLIFLIIMSISWAITSILVRTSKKSHWLQIQIVAAVQGACIWTPMLLLLNRYEFNSDLIAGGKWSSLSDIKYIGLIVLCALFGFAGLSLNVIGYQIGDATKVAWMEYFDLIFAFIFQWCVFGTIPDVWEWVGLACLLSTCIVHITVELIKNTST